MYQKEKALRNWTSINGRPTNRGDLDVFRMKVGEDDDGKTVRVSLRDFVSYARFNRDDSPLYVFDQPSGEKHGRDFYKTRNSARGTTSSNWLERPGGRRTSGFSWDRSGAARASTSTRSARRPGTRSSRGGSAGSSSSPAPQKKSRRGRTWSRPARTTRPSITSWTSCLGSDKRTPTRGASRSCSGPGIHYMCPQAGGTPSSISTTRWPSRATSCLEDSFDGAWDRTRSGRKGMARARLAKLEGSDDPSSGALADRAAAAAVPRIVHVLLVNFASTRRRARSICTVLGRWPPAQAGGGGDTACRVSWRRPPPFHSALPSKRGCLGKLPEQCQTPQKPVPRAPLIYR